MAVSSTLQSPWYVFADFQNSPSESSTFLSPFSATKDPEIDYPISRLPKELILTIFSYLNADELEKCSLTCKQWKSIANDEALWKALYAKAIFGQEQWKTYFGDIGEVPPFPPNIHQILKAPCPFWKGKKVYETHLLVIVPQKVNGQPLNLKTLEELVKKPLQGHATQYRYFSLGKYPDPPVLASHWTLMSRNVIPNSHFKSYTNQKTLIQGYAEYELPKVLGAAVAVLVEYVRTGIRLYGDNPWTYTRCQEMWDNKKGFPLAVGGFAPKGLNVVDYYYSGEDVICGVGAFRKF